MRNGHEVIRGAIRDLDALLTASKHAEFEELYPKFKRWQMIHARMEDGDPNVEFAPGKQVSWARSN